MKTAGQSLLKDVAAVAAMLSEWTTDEELSEVKAGKNLDWESVEKALEAEDFETKSVPLAILRVVGFTFGDFEKAMRNIVKNKDEIPFIDNVLARLR